MIFELIKMSEQARAKTSLEFISLLKRYRPLWWCFDVMFFALGSRVPLVKCETSVFQRTHALTIDKRCVRQDCQHVNDRNITSNKNEAPQNIVCQRLDYYYVEVVFVAVVAGCNCVCKIYVYTNGTGCGLQVFMRWFNNVQILARIHPNACVFELCYLPFFVATADCPNTVRRSSQLRVQSNAMILFFLSCLHLVGMYWFITDGKGHFLVWRLLLLRQLALSLTLHFSAIECFVLPSAHLLIRRTKCCFLFGVMFDGIHLYSFMNVMLMIYIYIWRELSAAWIV